LLGCASPKGRALPNPSGHTRDFVTPSFARGAEPNQRGSALALAKLRGGSCYYSLLNQPILDEVEWARKIFVFFFLNKYKKIMTIQKKNVIIKT
jgi:hypothetical protein